MKNGPKKNLKKRNDIYEKNYKEYKQDLPETSKYLGDFGDFSLYLNKNGDLYELYKVFNENVISWQSRDLQAVPLIEEEVGTLEDCLKEYDETDDSLEKKNVKNYIEELFL